MIRLSELSIMCPLVLLKTNRNAWIINIDNNVARVDMTVLPNKSNTAMTNKTRKYLLVIEWNDPSTSANNKGVLFYSVCPRDSMMPEEFEKPKTKCWINR